MNATTRRFLAALALSFAASSLFAAEPCKVNVSTCGPAECALLPGVGMVTAGRISAAHPKTEAELDAVKGIGPKKMDSLKPFVTYAGETTCTEKQHAPKS